MDIKIEVNIVIWQDGLFKLKDRVLADDTHSAREQFDVAMDMIENKLEDDKKKEYVMGEDDDIPF